jgi:hypothetical protein
MSSKVHETRLLTQGPSMKFFLFAALCIGSSIAHADSIRCVGKNVDVQITKSESSIGRRFTLNGYLRNVTLEDVPAGYNISVSPTNRTRKDNMILFPEHRQLEGRRIFIELHPTSRRTRGLYYKVNGVENTPEFADQRTVAPLVCTHN